MVFELSHFQKEKRKEEKREKLKVKGDEE